MTRTEPGSERRELSFSFERIGQPRGEAILANAQGEVLLEQSQAIPDHEAALGRLFQWLPIHFPEGELGGVGHRVVHGGEIHSPQPVTPALLEALSRLVPLDPDHLPQALEGIQAVSRLVPGLPQVACFDTAFHARLPRVAQLYALPRALLDSGVRRIGFHGLSYEYLLQELRAEGVGAADGRVVMAHLGGGASLAAVRGGRCIDTSMGMTPLAGLVMGARCGDVDPGVLLYLLRERGLSPEELSRMLNHDSGLKGVSGTTSDMESLLARERSDERAAEAVALFCYRARGYLGAYAAALGGLDLVVFTGGIGEHAASVRARICEGLSFLGLDLDPGRNAAGARVISSAASRVEVRVMATDEDRMVARHTRAVLLAGGRGAATTRRADGPGVRTDAVDGGGGASPEG